MEQKGPFPAVTRPIWGLRCLVWVLLCSTCPVFSSCSPTGSTGVGSDAGAGSSAAPELWAHRRLPCWPARNTCNNMFFKMLG